MEPGFCRLLALSHTVNCSWLCVGIKSEQPAAERLQHLLEQITSRQRNGSFSALSCGTAGAWSFLQYRGSPTLMWYINAKSGLKDLVRCAGASPRMLLQIKDSTRSKRTAKQCFQVVCCCRCAELALSTSIPHMKAGQLTGEVPVDGCKQFALCETHH